MLHETALDIQKKQGKGFFISTASSEVPDIERVDLEQALKKAPLVLAIIFSHFCVIASSKTGIVLITLHRVGRNKTGNHDDPWSAQTSTQSDRHVTKRLPKRDANRYGGPFVSKLFVNVMFNVIE